ncbi:protein mab-21-like 3 [Saccoglossus kowalevskii]
MAVGCGTIDMTILNQYKDEQVVIRRKETKTAVDIVQDVLDRILGRVHDQDPRFSHEPWASGSHAARLKVCEPNEFDYDVPLEGLSSFVWETDINDDSPRGYHIITLKEPDLSNLDDMVEGDQLEPRLVKQTFRKLVKEAIEYSGLQRQIKQRVQGPAITLDISHKDTVISIDLVPLVPDNGCGLLPEVLSSWPRSRVWPPADKVTEMKKIGNTSVAKDDEFWLTSFGRCELELIKEIDKDDGCRKECLRILKKLREDNWRYPPNKPVLTSFHLKAKRTNQYVLLSLNMDAESPLKLKPAKVPRLTTNWNKCLKCQRDTSETLSKASAHGQIEFIRAAQHRQDEVASRVLTDVDSTTGIFPDDICVMWHRQ